ncbi:zinc finger protein [Ciona intestinalis]
MKPIANYTMRNMPMNTAMHTTNLTNQDHHTRQTLDRLECIQKHLKNPDSFSRTARELLEWCSDARAFQRQFHQSLLGCLTVVSEVAGKPGYEPELCYKLLALCNDHRDKFSPNAASMLSKWLHEVNKRTMLQSHMEPMKVNNSISPGSVPVASPITGMMTQKLGFPQPHMGQRPHEPPQNWNPPQPPMQPNHHPSLSVITTVWGVSTTQTPPVPVRSQSNATSFAQQHMGHPDPMQTSYNYQHDKPGMGNMYHSTSSMYANGHRGMGPGRYGNNGSPGHHMPDQSHHPPAAAAAAAAIAAAAAAATATATATATFIKEHQEQPSAYDPNTGGMMDHHMHPNMNHPSNAHPMMQQPNRFRPQMPQQYNRGPGSYQMGTGMGPMQNQRHPSVPNYNNEHNFKTSCRPQQSYGQVPFNGSPNMPNHYNKPPEPIHATHQHPGGSVGPRYSPRLPNNHPHPNSQQKPYFQGQHGDPNGSYAQRHGYSYPADGRNINSHQPNPIPGNPTPPLTPGSAHNVPPYPNTEPAIPAAISEGKSTHDELRLTFPVRDGIVLGPFRLGHNLVVSSHAFHLRPNVYRTLFERHDLDLQFKCYHHEDMLKHTNWPHSVQVSANHVPLTIPRGQDRLSHKPLYLKKVCQPGRNTVDITVSACCCSHFFVLQLVHRPSIRFALKGLMLKRVLPGYHCIEQIKRNFANGAIGNSSGTGMNCDPGGEMPPIKVSLRCPITYTRIKIPARGKDCKHIQCFDLESYLQMNSDNATWRCPICHKNALLEYLEVDQYIQNILKAVQDRECHLVSIDANCKWTPLPVSTPHDGAMRGGPDPAMNGIVKTENFDRISVKQEPSPMSGPFNTKTEPQFISALSIKQEPHHHRTEVHVKQEPDGPPNKRLKSVTSPGLTLSNLPAIYDGSYSSQPCHRFNSNDSNQGYSQGYDFNRCSVASNPTPCPGFMRGGPAVPMGNEISDNIARNDMVPIEKRLNHAALSTGNNGSPNRRGPGNPKTPQDPNIPIRPPSSSSLTPQSNNCPTPSSGAFSAAPTCGSINPLQTPNLNSNQQDMNACKNEPVETCLNPFPSLFDDDGVTSVPSISFDGDSVDFKTDAITDETIGSLDILPDNSDLDQILSMPDDLVGTDNTDEQDILHLFDKTS